MDSHIRESESLATVSRMNSRLYEVMDVLTNFIVVILYNIYVFQINTLYTLTLHNVICQLYLSKTGEKWIKESSARPDSGFGMIFF